MDFVMFEDVDGMEVFVNPERVIWVREYPGQTTVIRCRIGQASSLNRRVSISMGCCFPEKSQPDY